MIAPLNDSQYPIRLDSAFAPDLVVESMQGNEELGRPFEYRLSLISQSADLEFPDIVGTSVTITLETDPDRGEAKRYFNGVVTEFRYSGSERYDFFRYEAVVRPKLWLLTLTTDCRIFQEMTVPDIILEVFRDHGLSDFETKLNRTYRSWEYCVQYRETDFDFVSRLMEQEGIYYFFQHENGVHKLVLIDSMTSHPKSNPENISTRVKDSWQSDLIDSWRSQLALRPEQVALTDYNFETPKVDLLSVKKATVSLQYRHAEHEVFDYPGEFTEAAEGQEYATDRIDELQIDRERFFGEGNPRSLATGELFTLENHARAGFNVEYLVVASSFVLNNVGFVSNLGAAGSELYRCQLSAITANSVFRPRRLTPRPSIRGCQPALVVGKAGEEIYTDKYGRVKVQFYWDRYGQRDENSSCWIRVSQAWAGKDWGSMHIPRIGHEVLVSFLEGDPDQPIITGRVYNADNMPPYGLEANKTQSGIKSRSSKGGSPSNFNEIRMEDKKGSEELYIQAEKDENILVKNDKSETVGHDETINIGNDRTETVGRNETLTVGVDRVRNVGSNETVTVSSMRTHNVGINESINVGAAQEVVVGGFQAIEVGAYQNTDVGGWQSVSVGASQSIEIGSDQNVDIGKNRKIEIADGDNLKVGKKLVYEVGDSVTIKCGKASIIMKKSGDVTIKGKNIVFNASGKIQAKASGNVILKGSAIKEN